MKNLNATDWALRVLIVACGVIAAALLTLRGQAQALAPLAVGATLGAAMMARVGPSEEEQPRRAAPSLEAGCVRYSPGRRTFSA